MKIIRNPILRMVLSVLIVTPLLTGCWDRTEIEGLAIVLGIGIDTVQSNGQQNHNPDVTHVEQSSSNPKSPLLHLTAQIAVPGRIPLGPSDGGGGGGKGSPQEQAVWIVSADGHTVNDALVNLQQKIANELYLSHLRIIVVSEEFLRTVGCQNLNDFIRRNPEVRKTGYVVACKDRAEGMLGAAPPLERVPTLYLAALINQAIQGGKLPGGMIGDYLIKSANNGQEPYLPYLDVKDKKNVQIYGLACLRNNKMVGSIQPIQIATYNELTGMRTGGYTVHVPIPSISTSVMVKAVARRTTVHVRLLNGKLYMKIHPYIHTYIVEKATERGDLNNPKVINEIETALSKELETESRKLIQETKSMGSDIFGFGEYVRGKQPRYWDKYIRTQSKWDQAFKHMPVEVHVTVTVMRMQMKSQ